MVGITASRSRNSGCAGYLLKPTFQPGTHVVLLRKINNKNPLVCLMVGSSG